MCSQVSVVVIVSVCSTFGFIREDQENSRKRERVRKDIYLYINQEVGKKKCNLQFLTVDVRRLRSLGVYLCSRGVTVAAPHGVKLRAELFAEPAPLFHPKHTNLHTSAHCGQHT